MGKSAKWTLLKCETNKKHDNHPYLWFDSMDCNVLFIGGKPCIEWMDIRENRGKWNILSEKNYENEIKEDGDGFVVLFPF